MGTDIGMKNKDTALYSRIQCSALILLANVSAHASLPLFDDIA